MNADQIANIAYLALLGSVIAGYFFVQNRQNLGKTMQMAAVWGLIFVGVIAAVGMWGDITRNVSPRQSMVGDDRVEVPRGPDGHYHLRLDVNDAPVHFIVDTGATDMVLSQRDAARAGLDPDELAFLGSARTANGVVRTASVTLDEVRLGDISDSNIRAVVNEGELDVSLLGMSYLNLFSRIEIEGDRLILTR